MPVFAAVSRLGSHRHRVGEIAQAARAFVADPTQGALIVTGQGEKSFISGADIEELAPLGPAAAEDISRFGQAVVEILERSPKPVIAAVNGYAFGGGCELALALPNPCICKVSRRKVAP